MFTRLPRLLSYQARLSKRSVGALAITWAEAVEADNILKPACVIAVKYSTGLESLVLILHSLRANITNM